MICRKEQISEVSRLETALFEAHGVILNKDGGLVVFDSLDCPLQDIPVISLDINLDHVYMADSTACDEGIHGCHGDRDTFIALAVPARCRVSGDRLPGDKDAELA